MAREKHGARSDICVHSAVSSDAEIAEERTRTSVSAIVHVVDDDRLLRESLGDLLQSVGYQVMLHGSVAEFLNVESLDAPACIVLDVRLPGTNGLEFQERLKRLNISLPIILMTGAVDFLTKPMRDQEVLDAVATAIRIDQDRRRALARIAPLRERYELLTPREREVMALVASGLMNKQVASKLSISEVTVKMHRSGAMRKLAVKSLAKLARVAAALEIGE
jgi:FixJ family two-component response regulator